MINIARYFAVFVFVTIATATTASNAFDAPKGDVILTVSGKITDTNSEGAALFDLEMLQKLGSKTFKTSTIWTAGAQSFTGVQLTDLLSILGVKGGTLRASAINDYAVEIPVSDAVEGGPIVAYARNGALMSVRDKGPLWLVYPYDSSKKYRSEQIYSRSIWQLDRIEVLP